MDPIVATFVILALAIAAFVSGRVPLGIVAVGVSLALWATGVLSLSQALAGFSDPTVLFVASLFVVSESLDATGVTAWAAQKMTARAGTRRGRITVIVSLLVAVLTAFISLNGATAALLPVVVVVALRAGIAPSKLLIPLAFAAHAGSLLALTGTPVNVIVSEAAVSAGGRAFGYFEFALVGLPLLAITVAITAAFGGRLLPERRAASLDDRGAADPSAQADRLRESYQVDVATGALFTIEQGVVEVVIPPRSPLVGRRVYAGITTQNEGLVVLAVRAGGRRSSAQSGAPVDGTTSAIDLPVDGSSAPETRALQSGDSVLVQGPWDALERYVRSPDVIAVTSPQSLRRGIPLGRGAKRALGILALMVVLLATGAVPPVVAGLLAAGAIVLTRVLSVNETYRSIQWTTVLLIAGMIPLSTAFTTTGAAQLIADALLGIVGGSSPYLALLAVCVLTVLLGQLISNVATVLIVIPVAVSLAAALGVSVMPFMMGLTVAGAAAFLTPIATPANLMVMEPGGYRFGDYWRLGLPLALIYIAVATVYVPLIWPF